MSLCRASIVELFRNPWHPDVSNMNRGFEMIYYGTSALSFSLLFSYIRDYEHVEGFLLSSRMLTAHTV